MKPLPSIPVVVLGLGMALLAIVLCAGCGSSSKGTAHLSEADTPGGAQGPATPDGPLCCVALRSYGTPGYCKAADSVSNKTYCALPDGVSEYRVVDACSTEPSTNDCIGFLMSHSDDGCNETNLGEPCSLTGFGRIFHSDCSDNCGGLGTPGTCQDESQCIDLDTRCVDGQPTFDADCGSNVVR